MTTPVASNLVVSNATATPTLIKRDGLHCALSDVMGIFSDDWDVDCRRGYHEGLSNFFEPLAWNIEDDWTYGNYDRIICSSVTYDVCAFFQYLDPGVRVTGNQVKLLFKELAKWCDLSTCGSVEAYKVEGEGFAVNGQLKVDGVKDTGGCFEVCPLSQP